MEINWSFLNKFNIVLAITLPILTVIFYAIKSYWRKGQEIKRLEKTVASLENKIVSEHDNLLFNSVLNNIEEVKSKLLDLINEGTNNKLRIDNFGLDFETVVSIFKYTLNSTSMDRDVRYRGLIINPDSKDIEKVCGGGSNLSQNTARDSIQYLKEITLKPNVNISIKVYSYDNPPIIHGFLVDDEHLIIGLTHFDKGGLVGGGTPYLYVKKDKSSDFNMSLFEVYTTWFDYWMANGRQEVVNKDL